MQITRRADYAVRTMLDVAGLEEGAVALTHEVARRQGVPAPFLAKIVLALTRAGLLRSFRGAGGGILLARPPDRITLLEVVEAVDGPIAMNRCVLWPEECERVSACPVHDIWAEAQALLAGHLASVTLSSLVEKGRTGRRGGGEKQGSQRDGQDGQDEE